ncbi:hypothetical protein K6120_01465 [Neisseria flava]|nr:hypothetical protein [Neisseria flava]
MKVQLSDMEELINSCTETPVKKLMSEALVCYNAGSYRSAIITIWHAICFDLCLKAKELDELGDAPAEKIIKQLDEAKKELLEHKNPSKMTKFEKDIAEKFIKDDLGLSVYESSELKKIYEDRHIAAHPALYDEELPEFTPEKVRAHFIHAIKFLLSNNFYIKNDYKEKIIDFFNQNWIYEKNLIKNIIEKRYVNIRPSNLDKTLEELFFNIGIYKYIKDELSYFKLSYLIEKISEKYKSEFDAWVNKKISRIMSTREPEDLLISIAISSYANFNDESLEHVKKSITELKQVSIHKFLCIDHIRRNNLTVFKAILTKFDELVTSLETKAGERIKLFNNLPKSIVTNKEFYNSIIRFYLSFEYEDNVVRLETIEDLYEKYIFPIEDDLDQNQFEKIFDKILVEHTESENKRPRGWTVYYRNRINKLLLDRYETKFPKSDKYSKDDKKIIITDPSYDPSSYDLS